jgi:hypothetical protein
VPVVFVVHLLDVEKVFDGTGCDVFWDEDEVPVLGGAGDFLFLDLGGALEGVY